MEENQFCLIEDAEVEKSLSLKKSNNAGQHFVLTNKCAKIMKLSGNANKKQKAHIELKSAAEGIN